MAQHRDKGAVVDREIEAGDSAAVAPLLAYRLQLDPGHGYPLMPPMVIWVRYFWQKT